MDEQNLTDVRYALKQLRGIPGLLGAGGEVKDRITRAINALERIEDRLSEPQWSYGATSDCDNNAE